ncbi:MAG TPA: cytochrome b N-terminal domain-containing protein [Phycisphaerales bacterium]|nr:cytochrome b N-terminal domain-containing protein [Phycisphaerales bacterium]HMP36638.1 cytochrome b N-terminal domain-containing protein [Phycisphaerales bacterium]
MKILRRAWGWLDDRAGISETLGPMATHLVPRSAKWWYVFGSATLCAFIVQVTTGIGLAFAYVPSGGEAYASLQAITDGSRIGHVLRGMHYFGASAMVVMVVLHLAQVFLHGSYKYPRELNWLTGVVLFFMVLGMAFTGQLLRWDANAVWSVVVAAEQADRLPWLGPALGRFIIGGETIGGATLSRFFVLHVFLIPAGIFAFIGLHLWLVLRHGVSEMPRPGHPVDPATYVQRYERRIRRTGVPFWPVAAWRDMVVATLMVGTILVLAVTLGPPALDQPPDPSAVNANPAPDWYLLFYFAVLALLPPWLESWVIIGAPLLLIVALIAVPFVSNRGERAPSRRPWAIAIVVVAAVGFVSLTILGVKEPWSPDFGVQPLPAEVLVGLDPRATEGAALVHAKGCLYCHHIDGHGGFRGPELSTIGTLLTRDQMIIRIMNGGTNMPSFAGTLDDDQLARIVDFLLTRRVR